MHNNISRCIDLNSPYCPCLLAETNNCVFCNHLQGKATCDCNWAGVCILYEKHWQSPKRHERGDEGVTMRLDIEAEYQIVKRINDDTFRLEIAVPEDLARSLAKTGSFIFLRRPGDPDFYHFPVGVMKVDSDKIEVVVEAIGPKSRRILSNDNRRLLVKGPYFNGIFGQPWIDNTKDSRILLVAGGMGQAPALPIAAKLVNNSNQVTAILAPGHTGSIFIDSELKELGVEVQSVPSMRRIGVERLMSLFDTYDLVISAGPDEQHYGVIDAMQRAGVNLPMAATNNATMCCGEGICGSCQKETSDNRIIRTCKVQTNFSNIVRD